MAFQQGLSGLNAASKSLDVIGNNIANSETVGFKSSQAQFADIYATSLNSATSGKQAGIGVSVSTVFQQFSQGNLETSGNSLDMAISGNGFYRVFNNNQVQYSRNGQFHQDLNGYIINAQGAQLTGYLADASGKIITGNVQPIKIDPSDMKPNATTTVATSINLNSNETMPTVVPFDANNTDSYTKQIPTTVYDTLGNAHVMSAYYVKTGVDADGKGTWDVYLATDGMEATAAKIASASQTDPASIAARAAYQAAVTAVPLDPAAVQTAALNYATAAGTAVTNAAADPLVGASAAQLAAIAASYNNATADSSNKSLTPDQIDAAIGATVAVPPVKVASLTFTTVGTLDKAAMLAAGETLPIAVALPIFPATGAKPILSFSLDFTGSTQIAATTAEKRTTQDGYAGGQLTGYAADTEGVLVGQYSNGKTRDLGQIVLANFADPNGLAPQGNNIWLETSASGAPLIGTPASGSLGQLRSSTVETSNVDLTAELVNMITAQRAYQANAQTIKTEDSILQTLVNLR